MRDSRVYRLISRFNQRLICKNCKRASHRTSSHQECYGSCKKCKGMRPSSQATKHRSTNYKSAQPNNREQPYRLFLFFQDLGTDSVFPQAATDIEENKIEGEMNSDDIVHNDDAATTAAIMPSSTTTTTVEEISCKGSYPAKQTMSNYLPTIS